MPKSALSYSWWTPISTIIQLRSYQTLAGSRIGQLIKSGKIIPSQLGQGWAHCPSERYWRHLYWARRCTSNRSIMQPHNNANTRSSTSLYSENVHNSARTSSHYRDRGMWTDVFKIKVSQLRIYSYECWCTTLSPVPIIKGMNYC